MAVTNWLFHTFDRTRTIHTDTHVRTVHCTHFMANAITKNPRVFILKEISLDQKIYHQEPSENPTLELPKIHAFF